MLNSIRNFSKTIFAKILLVIVVIPFVFWGMGGVFSSGNTNSLAKIDNINISTQEFIEHINDLNINQEAIRENLDNEIVEELLSELISKKILEIQINELDINITEKNLANIIKKNPNMYGYVKIDKQGFASRVTCKKKISGSPWNDHTIIGTFTFKKAKYFIHFANKLIKNNLRVNNEFYIDSIADLFVKSGFKVKVNLVKKYFGWGTPMDLNKYLKK